MLLNYKCPGDASVIVGTFHCKMVWAHPVRHIGVDIWAQQSRGHFILIFYLLILIILLLF